MTFEPLEKEYWENPYPYYQRLHEQPSLPWAPRAQVFCASRFEEASEVFKDPELFSSAVAFDLLLQSSWQNVGVVDVFEMLRFLVRARVNPLALRSAPETLLTSDPPKHEAMRNIVNRGFSPRRVAAWEPRIRELSQQYVAKLKYANQFDVVEGLTHPLPMSIIAEMLGVETHRLADFRRWSNSAISSLTGCERSLSPRVIMKNGGEALEYLRSIVRRRQQEPGEDLISVLVDPKHGDTLDTQSVLMFAMVLLIAGNETTTSAIGNTVKLLLERPQVLEEVSADPSLIPALVEESLRFESPFQFMPRRATRDTELRETPIPRGSTVLAMIGAANRDPRYFPEPDRFDIHRDTTGHLAFGYGVHFCLGSHLARLEVRVALEELIPALAGCSVADGGAVYGDSYITRGLARLEVTRSTPMAVGRPQPAEGADRAPSQSA
ncbi:MAG: cytochrome P450 [Deltaproteobacteria bacterium]|nr:cytochrome P450 [Deltaproteobacteria bacterium]